MDANCTSGMESHEKTDRSLIRLPISCIRPFEKSPRREPNTAHLRLKASIRRHGLDQAFIVTQPPGATHYVLAAGGTTRLSALREIAAETGGTDFATAPCIVTPWPGDTALILAHLRENDLRRGLTFIEQACAVAECQRLLEAETGRALSQEEVAALLLRHGYGFSVACIAQMRYAVTRLLEVMPTSLDSGLGIDAVQRIHRLDALAAICGACTVSTQYRVTMRRSSPCVNATTVPIGTSTISKKRSR